MKSVLVYGTSTKSLFSRASNSLLHHHGYSQEATTAFASAQKSERRIRPFEDMPTPKLTKYQRFTGMVRDRYNAHKNLQLVYQELGGVVRDSYFGLKFVYVGDKEEIRKLHSYDGKMPQRL